MGIMGMALQSRMTKKKDSVNQFCITNERDPEDD